MKKLVQKFGKWAVVYVIVDNACAVAIFLGWYFYWPPLV